MGLFDRLFKKHIENRYCKRSSADLSEEAEENQTAVEETACEETARDKVEKHLLKKNFPSPTEEVIGPEAVEETAQKSLGQNLMNWNNSSKSFENF